MVESSHAFRADRSQHTCLRQIKQQFRNTNWYIVGDTSSCFTKVNHNKCLHLLGHTKKYALQRNRLKPSIQRCVSPFTNSLDSPTIRYLRWPNMPAAPFGRLSPTGPSSAPSSRHPSHGSGGFPPAEVQSLRSPSGVLLADEGARSDEGASTGSEELKARGAQPPRIIPLCIFEPSSRLRRRRREDGSKIQRVPIASLRFAAGAKETNCRRTLGCVACNEMLASPPSPKRRCLLVLASCTPCRRGHPQGRRSPARGEGGGRRRSARRVSNSGIGYEGGKGKEARKWTGGLPESANNNAPKLCNKGLLDRRRRRWPKANLRTQEAAVVFFRPTSPYRRVTFGRAAQTSPELRNIRQGLPSDVRSRSVVAPPAKSRRRSDDAGPPRARVRFAHRRMRQHQQGGEATKERLECKHQGVQPLQQPVLRQLPSLFNNKCFAPVTSKKASPSVVLRTYGSRRCCFPLGRRPPLAVGGEANVVSSLFALSEPCPLCGAANNVSCVSFASFVGPSSQQAFPFASKERTEGSTQETANLRPEGAQRVEGLEWVTPKSLASPFFGTSAPQKGYAEALEANYNKNKVSPLFRSFVDASSLRPLRAKVAEGQRPLLENTILYALDLFVLRLQSIAAPIKQSHEAKRFALCSSCASLIGATRVGSDDQRADRRGATKEHLFSHHNSPFGPAASVPRGYESIEHATVAALGERNPSLKRSSAFTCTCLSYLPTAKGPQLHYVRFAHHFLIGVTGSKQYVTNISDMLSRFLQTRLELQLQLDTLQIKHAKQDRVPFLGYLIQHIWPFSRQGGSSKQGLPTKQSQLTTSLPLRVPRGLDATHPLRQPSPGGCASIRKGGGRADRRRKRQHLFRSLPLPQVLRTLRRAIRSVTHRRQNRTRMPFQIQRRLRASPLEAQTKQRNKLGCASTRPKGEHGRFFRGEALCFETKHSALTSIDLLSKKANLSERNHYASNIRLLVNMPKVIHSLAAKGFCDRSGNPKPNFYYFQDSQAIAVARVASVLRGLANYYHLAESRRRCVSRWSYILTHSLAMMFAAKFKLGTRAKVFALAGRNLSKPLLAQQRKRRMLRQKH